MAVSDAEPVRVICGPTAAGKSAIALALCEEYGAELVSADSRQLYRGFDIGTATPTPEERARVPHRGINVLDPAERASAEWWAASADRWIEDAHTAARLAVVVGGTGLYLRALFGELFVQPALDVERRRALAGALDPLPTRELRRWVTVLDPARAAFGRTQLLRALEIALLTGHRVSALHGTATRPPRRRARYLVVDPGAALGDRIGRRIEQMLQNGWAEEVRTLIDHVPPEAPAWNASGYRALRDWVQGRATRSEAIERVRIETRQYAKRQRTWFRHQLPESDVVRLDSSRSDALVRARAWWTGPAR